MTEREQLLERVYQAAQAIAAGWESNLTAAMRELTDACEAVEKYDEEDE